MAVSTSWEFRMVFRWCYNTQMGLGRKNSLHNVWNKAVQLQNKDMYKHGYFYFHLSNSDALLCLFLPQLFLLFPILHWVRVVKVDIFTLFQIWKEVLSANLLRVCITKRNWIWSNAFSTSIEMIVWFCSSLCGCDLWCLLTWQCWTTLTPLG